METTRRISPKTLAALAIGAGFVVAGVVMVVVGWPEQHRWQTVLLELSGVMFALAVATAIWRMVSERRLMKEPTRNFRLVRLATIIGVALGALLYVLAFATGNLDLAPLGQFFIWIGLGAMFAYLAAGAIRRELTDRVVWEDVADDGLDPLHAAFAGDDADLDEAAPRRAAGA